jgi:predicted metal-dependent peptidase
MAKRRSRAPDPAEETFLKASWALQGHPMFRPLFFDPTGSGLPQVHTSRREDNAVTAARGWARVRADGLIEVNKLRRGTDDEWTWVLAHCLLHLGFGHLDADGLGRRPTLDAAYTAACCTAVVRFQRALRLGEPPFYVPAELPTAPEPALAARWRESGVPAQFAALGAGGGDLPDLAAHDGGQVRSRGAQPGAAALSWSDRLSIGLSAAATAAVDAAGELRHDRGDAPDPNTAWELARRWFVSSFPLLAALAGSFTIVAKREIAERMRISLAAVDASVAEIYINPLAGLSGAQWRFVLAHEMLHAALRHGDRVGPRDPYLWNVACDYVVNGWLVEMAVGEMPEGLLHDSALRGMSAEAVYDLIARDLRRLRRLGTLRGRGLGDILTEPVHGVGDPLGLDDFYRRALLLGHANHESQGRGLLPAGLVAEIRVLDQPPLPWDAKLAKWFEEHVPAVQKRRSYARPSRRQSATPHIPRPGWYRPEELTRQATFGVVLDTSGSMNHRLMGKALGAIASYAMARDVPAARVVYCDAVAYDAGYLPVESLAGRVRVRGRGGTELQPGVRLLERAEDFPPDGPILIITDGYCEPSLRVRREHAYLVPTGARLPFIPRGPVFYVR